MNKTKRAELQTLFSDFVNESKAETVEQMHQTFEAVQAQAELLISALRRIKDHCGAEIGHDMTRGECQTTMVLFYEIAREALAEIAEDVTNDDDGMDGWIKSSDQSQIPEAT